MQEIYKNNTLEKSVRIQENKTYCLKSSKLEWSSPSWLCLEGGRVSDEAVHRGQQ